MNEKMKPYPRECESTKKIINTNIHWHAGIGCGIGYGLVREGVQLLEALDKGENIKENLSKWLEKVEQEKKKSIERHELWDKILKADGFKKDGNHHEHFLYVSARRALSWQGIAGYKNKLEEHGGYKGWDLLVRVKSKLRKDYDEEEKEWLLNQEYEYLMKYGVITYRRTELVSARPEVRSAAKDKARAEVRAKARGE